MRGLICFLILLEFGPLYSQAITISEELPLRNDYAYTILGWVDQNLLLFRDRGHEFYVQSFDAALHLKWEREIFLADRKADIIGVIGHDDIFHIVFGVRDKGNYYIRHMVYNHEITAIDTLLIDSIENIFLTPRLIMAESEDENQIVLFREDHNTLFLLGYNVASRMRNWSHEIKLGGSNLLRNYSTMQVSNTGDFYLVLEPDRLFQKVQSLEVFCSVPGVTEVVKSTVELRDEIVYDYEARYDNVNGCLVIAGLYSERNTGRAQGFYFSQFRPHEAPQTHLLSFDESLLAEVHGREVSSNRGLSDFNVQEIALRKDGGAVIIAELNKEFSRRSSLPLRRDNGSFTRGGWIDYYYEDLILYAVHPDGKEHWKEVLRKRQYSQDDEAMYSSFFLFKTPSRLRFLFNDEIKQENTVGGYEVTGTGQVVRKTVFNTDYQRLKLRFKDGVQLAYNECVVPSERNNRLSLVRIVYDE